MGLFEDNVVLVVACWIVSCTVLDVPDAFGATPVYFADRLCAPTLS